MDNRGLLLIILVILVAAIGLIIVDRTSVQSSGEKLSKSINEVTEEIKDEIDDNTTGR